MSKKELELVIKCCYCHRQKVGEDKKGDPVYESVTPNGESSKRVLQQSSIRAVSHGICPPCYERATIDYYRQQARLYNPNRPGA